ncbi:hypothetical protein PspCFBP13528_23065 [Pseudomonas sp. CFBP13528]|nr:hypothetical protein PspCFBP13528_23065 [Pseudomonas sp. CFBP13528]
MLSTQPQACPPVHNSRLSHTAPASAAALAGLSPPGQAYTCPATAPCPMTIRTGSSRRGSTTASHTD